MIKTIMHKIKGKGYMFKNINTPAPCNCVHAIEQLWDEIDNLSDIMKAMTSRITELRMYIYTEGHNELPEKED